MSVASSSFFDRIDHLSHEVGHGHLVSTLGYRRVSVSSETHVVHPAQPAGGEFVRAVVVGARLRTPVNAMPTCAQSSASCVSLPHILGKSHQTKMRRIATSSVGARHAATAVKIRFMAAVIYRQSFGHVTAVQRPREAVSAARSGVATKLPVTLGQLSLPRPAGVGAARGVHVGPEERIPICLDSRWVRPEIRCSRVSGGAPARVMRGAPATRPSLAGAPVYCAVSVLPGEVVVMVAAQPAGAHGVLASRFGAHRG